MPLLQYNDRIDELMVPCVSETLPALMWTDRVGLFVRMFYLCYVASVLQVVLKQLCGAVLKGFGQSCQQHAELGSVELEQ